VVGEKGELTIRNPFVPQLYHRLSIRTAAGVRHEHFGKTPTYNYQLTAFLQAVRTRAPFPTDMRDAIANMRVIDAVYQAAGLKRRGT
jgi:predicted dehydrogenase